tara:strand:+ start:54 stop:302 length:249 start_codon:yes stop_codon:yes gene_type:complete
MEVIVARGPLKPGQYVYAYMRDAASFDSLKDAQKFIWEDVNGVVSFYRDYGSHGVKPMDYHIYLDGHFRETQVYGVDGKRVS